MRLAGTSLATRLTGASVVVALVTGVAITVAGYVAIRLQEREALHALARQHVSQEARRVGDRVDALGRGLEVGVGSPVLMSALVDSAGRETYVRPFLNQLAMYPGMAASVYFVDYAGHVVLASDGAPPLPDPQWTAQALAAGRASVHLRRTDAGGDLLYLVPLHYARTQRTEGALVGRVAFRDLVPADGGELVRLGATPDAAEAEDAAPVPLAYGHPVVDGRLLLRNTELTRVIATSWNDRAVHAALLGVALSVVLALALSRPLARRMTRDVDRLVAELEGLTADAAAPPSERRLSGGACPETARIAAAVNRVLAALERFSRGLQRERELRMAGIIESSTDAIITLDASHRIVQFNAAAAQMFRVPVEQALGGTLDPFLPPAVRTTHAQHIERFAHADSQYSRRMVRARSFRAQRADGEPFHAEATLTRARIDGHDYMTVLVRDVSDQVAVEAERQARAVAEAANQQKTAFLARMSHELRTPLNAIQGFAELTLRQRRPFTEADVRQTLELILGSSQRLLGLINDLLDVSRIELGVLPVNLATVDVAPVLAAVVRELDEAAVRQSVTLGVVAPHEPVRVLADETRLHQVVSNLVSNAIKYNRPGGRVTVTAAVRGARVVLCVADTGIGMSESQVAGLYQPFNRLGREASTAGTGIGLAIVKHLVQGMQGTIQVESRAGVGSSFTVSLRAAVEEAGGAPKGAAAAPAGPLERREDVAGTLLYVEDDPVNQLLVTSCMALRPSVTLRFAGDGQEALALVAREPVDAMLVDMMLPDMHGVALAQALRERLGAACPPLVAYSANAMADDIARARAAGFVDYLVKPTSAAELLGVLDRQLAVRAVPLPS